MAEIARCRLGCNDLVRLQVDGPVYLVRLADAHDVGIRPIWSARTAGTGEEVARPTMSAPPTASSVLSAGTTATPKRRSRAERTRRGARRWG